MRKAGTGLTRCRPGARMAPAWTKAHALPRIAAAPRRGSGAPAATRRRATSPLLERAEPPHGRPGDRRVADDRLGIVLLPAGDPRRADGARSRPRAALGVRRLLGGAHRLGAARACRRARDRPPRWPAGAGRVEPRARARPLPARRRAGTVDAGRSVAGARRGHRTRPVRLRFRHPRRPLRARGARPDHRRHLDRGFRQHRILAALHPVRGASRLARRVPGLGGGESRAGPAAQPAAGAAPVLSFARRLPR